MGWINSEKLSGWDRLGAGLYAAGGGNAIEERRLAKEDKEKDPFTKMQEWIAAKGMVETGGTPDDIINVLGSDVLGLKAKEEMKAGGYTGGTPVLTPKVIDPMANMGIKTDPAIDALRTKQATMGVELEKQGDVNVLSTLKDQTGKTVKSIQDLSRVTNAMSGMVATAKQAISEQGGAGIVPTLTGNAKRLYADLGIDKDISAKDQMSGLPKFKGQAREVTLALSPILTGSTRIMASVLNMLEKTIPQDLNKSEATIVGQMKQTFQNSYRLSLGLAQSGLTAEDIKSLEENSTEEQLGKLVKGLIDKGVMNPKDTAQFEEVWKSIKATPASKPETFGDGGYEDYLKAIGAK